MRPKVQALLRRGAPALALALLGLQGLLTFAGDARWADWAGSGPLLRRGLEALQGESLLRGLPFILVTLLWAGQVREGLRGSWVARLRSLGPILLALGALVGLVFARVSTHDLRPGEGLEVGGLGLRLLQAEARPKPEGLALSALAPDGKGGFEAPRTAQPVAVGLETETGVGEVRAQVLEVIPNALPSGEMVAVPEGPENPALQVMLGLGGTAVPEGWLPARDPRRNRFDAPGGAFAVCFRETFDPALLAELRAREPRATRLVLLVEGRTLSHGAEPGARWDLPGFSLQVEAVHPDFVAEPGPDGRPRFGSRSRQARNPWVQVRLTQAGGASAQLLVAADPPADPAYAAYLRAALPPGVDLRYVREGEERQDRFVLFTQADRRIRLVQGGRVVREAPLELRKPFPVAPGLSAVPMALLPRARYEDRWRPHPDATLAQQMLNPVVRVKVWAAEGLPEEGWVALGEGSRSFLGGKVALRLQPRVADPATTRAQVALGAGEPRWISTSEPWRRGLTALRVDQEAPLDPGRVRLRVERDPGRPLRLLGLVCLLLGWLGGIFPALRAGERR